jgi:hypothetical protein
MALRRELIGGGEHGGEFCVAPGGAGGQQPEGTAGS